MAKNVVKVEITPQSLKFIENVYRYSQILPNRIKSAEILTGDVAARKITTMIKNKYGNNAVKSFEIERVLVGRNVVIRIKSRAGEYQGNPKGKYDEDKVLGWIIKFTGRRAFSSQQDITYTTRPKSVGKYGKSRKSFYVPKQPKDMTYVRDIRQIGNRAAAEAVTEAFRRYGFGPRGGASRLKDLGQIRVRSLGGV